MLAAAATLSPDRTLDIELEIETGLGRGGFTGAGAVDAARRIAAAPGCRLRGLWTHLQAVESPEGTAVQVDRFEATVDAIGAAGIALPARHAAASAALLVDGVAAYDGVRPGLAVYGLAPDELAAAGISSAISGSLHPIMSLVARPVRVADLPAGTGISYGPTFRTARPSRIATLPLGYGDGWSRQLSNRATATRPRPAGAARRQRGDGRGDGGRDRRQRPAGHGRRRIRPARARRRRADQRRGPGAATHHEQLGSRHARWLADYPGCTMPQPDRSVCGRSPSGEPSGANRALERRHLRPRGRCDRQRRQHDVVDGDRCRWSPQAGRR